MPRKKGTVVEDDGEEYKQFCTPLGENRGVKKYTVMPSDRGGRLDDECPPEPVFQNSLAEDLESEDVDLVLRAVRRTKRQRKSPPPTTFVQLNPKVYFGASLKPKLRDGYIFGEELTFDVEVSKVAPPSNPCTNHRVLNELNALRIFDLMQSSSTTRSQMSHMILRPISFSASDGVEVIFPGDGEKSLFHDLYDAYMIRNGDGDEVREDFLKCFTWEPIDGQHILAACTKRAPNMTNNTEYQRLFSRWPAQVVVYDEPQFYMELSRQVNVDRVARCALVTLAQCLEKIRATWIHFGRVGPSSKSDTQAIVDRRAQFYSTLFAATGMQPTKEDPTLSELRTKFDVHLRFACLENEDAFKAVLRMCNDFDEGRTKYSMTTVQKGATKIPISWLRPLRVLNDADIRIFAWNLSKVEGVQRWYFDDIDAKVLERKRQYAVMNAMRWMLKDERPGHYTFKTLMEINLTKEHGISSLTIQELATDAGTSFVERWKGPACENFKKQGQYEDLIPRSIVRFMQEKMKGSTSSVSHFQWVSESNVRSDAHPNRTSQVQVIQSILDAKPNKLDEQCIWMVDCRFAGTDGGIIGTLEVPKILEQIIVWMSGVTRWNAIIMLPPNESTTTLRDVLTDTHGYEDMALYEGMYTFSCQSSKPLRFLKHDTNKLYFREVGGLLYIMHYPKESDWSPNAALQSGEQWPTTWAEPLKTWPTSEFNVQGRCSRTVMSILQNSAPDTWMVALVGLTHIVPVLVNDGMQHRITVFEGNEEIRSKVLDWMQTRQTRTRVSRQNTKKKIEAASSSSDASDLKNSNSTTMESTENDSIALEQQLNLEDSLPTGKKGTDTQIGSTPIINDISSEPIQSDAGHRTKHEDDILLGGDGNKSTEFNKYSDTMARDNVHHGIRSTLLESSIQADARWIQSISDLIYEEDGDFYIDRLNHFWIQKHVHDHIDVIERDQWGTYDGKYFKRIETVELFQRRASTSEAEREHSLEDLDALASSLLLNLSNASSGADASAVANLDKILDTPLQ